MLGRVNQWWQNLICTINHQMGFDVPKPLVIYLIGSLRSPRVPQVAAKLRRAGFEVFDDWHAAGAQADQKWREYEKARGHSYVEALNGYAATHVFEYDMFHLDRADVAVLVMPAGKSGHLEFGWAVGRGKRGYILFDKEPKRFDVMTKMATGRCTSFDQLLRRLRDNI